MLYTVGTATLLLSVITLAALVVRLLRAERRRADARIAALAMAVDDAAGGSVLEDADTPVPASFMLLAPDRSDVPEAPRSRSAGAWTLAGAAAVVVALSAATLVLPRGPEPGTPASAAPPAAAVELMALRHARDGDALAVSGLVRNPAAVPTPRLTAIVSLVDGAGRVTGRAEAAVEPGVLEPGKETAFRVTLTGAAGAGRYRLAFTDGTAVVPHVDRRADAVATTIARER